MRFYQMPSYRNPNYRNPDSDTPNLNNLYDDPNNYYANNIQRGIPSNKIPTGNKSWQPSSPKTQPNIVIPRKPGMKPQPEPQPVPQPVPQPEPQPEPQPVPQPVPQPEPQPVPQPRPQPRPTKPEMPTPSLRPCRPRTPIHQPNMPTPGICRPGMPIMQPGIRPRTPMMQPSMPISQPTNVSEEFMDRYNLLYGIAPDAFDNALKLIKNAVEGEREDELFYDDLISMAPTNEDKEIIKSIRNDEINHNAYFRQMYKDFTGKEITAPEAVEYNKPATYMEGISRAHFGELSAVERYRKIRKALPKEFYKDILFDIITDELKHASKYNYLITKNSV